MTESGWRAWASPPAGEPFVLVRGFAEHPGLWDLAADRGVLAHWVAIFRGNADYVRQIAAVEGDGAAGAAAERALRVFAGLLDDLEAGRAFDRLRTIHAVTLVREGLLRAHGIPDPYARLKAREAQRWFAEGERALRRAACIGGACPPAGARAQRRAAPVGPPQAGSPRRAGAGLEGRGRPEEAEEGDLRSDAPAEILGDLLAGNLFDLGSRATQEAFRAGTLDPAAARARFRAEAAALLPGLPAELRELLRPGPPAPGDGGEGRAPGVSGHPAAAPAAGSGEPEGRLVFFADNAGADFLLGALPAALYFSRRYEVRLVVNSEAASSDITFAEAGEIVPRLAARVAPLAAALESGRLRLVPSGTGSPGIDLRFVGDELNRAAAGARWLLLEGQGRAIETNWATRFRCPVLRAAAVKDPLVAGRIGVAPGAALLRGE